MISSLGTISHVRPIMRNNFMNVKCFSSLVGRNCLIIKSSATQQNSLHHREPFLATLQVAGPHAIRNFATSSELRKVSTMEQVEVDEASVQQRLGKVNMDFVRKAEKRNKERANRHRFFRRKDWMIAAFLFGLVISIYSYTIWAIQQEEFL